ncbi:hypothetical protein AB0J52_13640 [Spirillospora sp. NPDC049652]
MHRSVYRPQSDWAKGIWSEGRAEGMAQGQAEALLRVLESRGLQVPTKAVERITGCADSDQFEIWLSEVAFVERAEDLYEPDDRARAGSLAQAVLVVLRARDIEVPPAAAVRISECVDLDVLDVWIRKVAFVGHAEALFD